MTNRIFISHPLEDKSSLLRSFPRSGHEWVDRSLIRFYPESFELVPASWLFFYSPRGVEYFKKGILDREIIYPYKIGTFGAKTAQVFESLFERKCDFTGSGEKMSTQKEFIRLARQESVLFVQALHSQRSIQELCNNPGNFHDLIVYRNEPEHGIRLGTFDIAILTSPMNSRAFLANQGKANLYIAWGNTTAREMKRLNIPVFKTASQPNEQVICSIIERLLDSSNTCQ